MSKPYNFIYKKLVQSDEDVVGIISYSIYKNQKIKFIEDFKNKNDGQDPSPNDFDHFINISTSQQQLDFYKNDASVLIQFFLEKVLADDLIEREEYFSSRVHSELKNIKPNHMLDILKGATGSLLFVILTGALYVAVWSFSVSPKMIIEKIFDIHISSVKK